MKILNSENTDVQWSYSWDAAENPLFIFRSSRARINIIHRYDGILALLEKNVVGRAVFDPALCVPDHIFRQALDAFSCREESAA